jgi:hypothetical protein
VVDNVGETVGDVGLATDDGGVTTSDAPDVDVRVSGAVDDVDLATDYIVAATESGILVLGQVGRILSVMWGGS